MKTIIRLLAVALLSAAAAPAVAADRDSTEELVLRAETAVRALVRDENIGKQITTRLPHARAVMIFPALYRGAFIIGGEGGDGVLVARGGDGKWGGPAFVRLISASIGLQIGGQVAEAMLLVMTDSALEALLADKVKLGADVAVTVGPVGAGAAAGTSTAVQGADVWAFSRAEGLFGGGALGGGVLEQREQSNAAYYGGAVGVREIVAGSVRPNAQADGLRAILDDAGAR
ncbi:MAG: lipid-binding SYLF domain-containing protein [Alphaproteobacteria bacterium]